LFAAVILEFAGCVKTTGLSFTHDCYRQGMLELISQIEDMNVAGCIPVYGDMGAEELFVVGCRRELRIDSNF
jgi:hypothetical protein